ncbi:T9SS type A sorting domain-containing protein [uncultured Psychroserpens sp.]|uniref:T9SS type A sorting domain-containing protein n=1 Tax=uncultured Psychroserpens sp. TaxID=255436 RepID=UPI002639959D|nr:T9SS type A sorting domain-containing protein [uncultured Psychroserpens sp.]
MKNLICILVLFGFSQEFLAQDNSGYRIMRSSLGSSGSSQNVVTTKGTYKVSQSVGQASVIGTHFNNGYYLRQGYQQPLSNIIAVKGHDYNLEAEVYPNPFKESITIAFSNSILKKISVMVFDVDAKLVHSQEFLPAQKIKLKINGIATGTYFLKVISGSKHFNTKLIKI